jgi:mono/diheme cytochrome c family protein
MAAGYALMAAILAFGVYGLGQSFASGNFESEDRERDNWYSDDDDDNGRRRAAEIDPQYGEECGGCHMAYPPQLLPGGSWRKIMSGLDDHFGENAELDNETRRRIQDYLVRSSERNAYRKLLRNIGDSTPMRITELPYFVHEHRKIPARYVAGNERVRSLSQCNACHQGAERGVFDEDDVFIAGVGRWDD